MTRAGHLVWQPSAGAWTDDTRHGTYARGHRRIAMVGPGSGAVHIGFERGELAVGGFIGICMHTFEKALYVTEGALQVTCEGASVVLPTGGYALVPTGTEHRLDNIGDAAVRWYEVLTPQPRLQAHWRNTVPVVAAADAAARLAFGDPRLRQVGVFDGRLPPKFSLNANIREASSRMLIDKEAGSAHMNLLVVEFENEGLCNRHDHPFEEAYVILEGTISAKLEDCEYRLGSGDFAWTGVGVRHTFFCALGERVRWLEVQSPQPPSREGMRWHAPWE